MEDKNKSNGCFEDIFIVMGLNIASALIYVLVLAHFQLSREDFS